jgi:hypothetical protein
MARKKAKEKDPDEATATTMIRVRQETADQINDVAEALGWSVWRVVDDLLKTELPAAHGRTEAQRREIRKNKARIESAQEQARKAVGG